MNEVARELNLTPKQWEILKHRLESPEAIAESIGGYEEDQWHPDDVICVAEYLCEGDWEGATCIHPLLRDDVLEDAVDGCSYAAAIDESIAPIQIANIIKAGERLASKVSTQIGRKVCFPAY